MFTTTLCYQPYEVIEKVQEEDCESESRCPEDEELEITRDCSAPVSTRYVPLFGCDQTDDRYRSEDETGCPQECGEGGFAVGNSRYYVRRWNNKGPPGFLAQTTCRSEGGRLVSFNTGEEWDRVTWELQRTRANVFYYGLRNPPADWPV